MIKKIKAGFSLFLFFAHGMDAFSGDKQAALRSFIVPLTIGPLAYLITGLLYVDPAQSDFPVSQIIFIFLTKLIISIIFGVALVYACAAVLNRLNKMWLYLEAGNWSSVAFLTIVTLVGVVGALSETPRDEMGRAMIIMAFYGHAMNGFIAAHALRINWGFAGAIACLGIVADRAAWQVALALNQILFL